MTIIDNARKLRCIERELTYRRRVYDRLVREESMVSEYAAEEIAVMEAIARDYRALVEMDRPSLFPTPDGPRQ